ncbi:hypothetical protein Rhe02_30990 [Rhizocola hellebori]|uniref:Uncharacterized protein n=1 Tax=Rhizocola hellebori TaxID=1392758 RepID=A0A8J3Q892_9ACTN|nr:hypothetical protein [Rhizocola hellebori]GIH05032.1 hypothetical protein Rhe02_30990 [Rhizocola hellebori]
MGCLFILFAGLFPRLALIIFWILRPNLMDAAFSSWLWPILGFLFLPFATLMYVLLWVTGGPLDGWEWFWVGLCALLDIAHWGSGAFRRGRRTTVVA